MVALLPKACICEGIPPSVYNRGYAATRERAMADFRARWDQAGPNWSASPSFRTLRSPLRRRASTTRSRTLSDARRSISSSTDC